MTKLTSKDIERQAQEAIVEIDKKYGIDEFEKSNRQYKETIQKRRRRNNNNNRRIVVRNNHKRIGEVEVFIHNVKKVMVATGIAGLAVVSFAAGRASKETKNVYYTHNVLSENFFREPVYSGVKYIVQDGDSIWNIVRRYQDDTSEQAELVENIIKINDLEDEVLQPGTEIELLGIPSSKLYLFNYTDNFNLLDPIVEVTDRLKFLNRMKTDLSENEEASDYLDNVDRVLADWDSYKYSYIPGEKSDIFDMILTDIREACEDATEFGRDYKYYKDCYPISVIPEEELTKK